ncbi:MAG: hypothetical protein KY395_04720 [Actinobacteria bacterium]|nr:hypothetical protein [Actinomycetota bacterium]
MAGLERFTVPGALTDAISVDQKKLDEAWHKKVAEFMSPAARRSRSLYDPTDEGEDTPADALRHPVRWPAFPATLNATTNSPDRRVQIADASRDRQDEYCEWSVKRAGPGATDPILRVTFTTELPEYFEVLHESDAEAALALYREHVDPNASPEQIAPGGAYDRNNSLNRQTTEGKIMHLRTGPNNLSAAVSLASDATVLRFRDDTLVTSPQDLVSCGHFGEPLRSSDPQIAAAINGLATLGDKITLEDPVGLYIDGIRPEGLELPAGVTLEDCWHVERGTAEHAVRASFSLPEEAGTLKDVRVRGAPLRFGAQLADLVRVRIVALSHSRGSVDPETAGCVA